MSTALVIKLSPLVDKDNLVTSLEHYKNVQEKHQSLTFYLLSNTNTKLGENEFNKAVNFAHRH